jgi:hypothetical protein
MNKIILFTFVLLITGCARDVREKTLKMTNQQKALNEMCKQRPESIQKKFTGSGSTITMKCEGHPNINSRRMQEILHQHGWRETQRTEEAILYCLTDNGIALVTSLDDRKQTIHTIMQYPSASCGSAFSIYRKK